MENMNLMAIDLGTSFVKAGVYDTEGHCLAITQRAVESDHSIPGMFVQKGDEIFHCALSSMKQISDILGAKRDTIKAIGFTGQMAGFIGVDEEWRDITSWSCSLDTRYTPYAEKQMALYRKEFLEMSGTNAPLMSPKCEWFTAEFPKEAGHVAKYMLISSYIIGRLGNCNVMDATIGSSYITWTGLADIKRGKWSKALCANAGVSVEKLPRIVKSDEVCAYLDSEIAKSAGLKPGIPLIAGAGDKISGCIGAGVLNQGDMIFEASSYGAVSCLVHGYRPNIERRDYDAIPALYEGDFYIHKYLPGSGITLKWYVDTFLQPSKEKGMDFIEIEKAARQIPCGSEGLMAVGLLGGSAMPFDGNLRGAWVGHTWSHKKAHFYRALLESYAYEIALTVDSMRSMYPEWKSKNQIKMVGGGAGSLVWPQILADVTGCDFVRLVREDVSLWGAAVLAGKGIGIFRDLESAIGKTVQIQNEIKPCPSNYLEYQKYKNIYSETKDALHDTYVLLRGIR